MNNSIEKNIGKNRGGSRGDGVLCPAEEADETAAKMSRITKSQGGGEAEPEKAVDAEEEVRAVKAPQYR